MEIKSTFEFYFSYFERKKLFFLFPKLKRELLNQYQIALLNSEKKVFFNDYIQEYRQVINTGIGNDYYEVSWSITKIDKIISENNIPIFDFNINEIFSDEKNINLVKLDFYKNIDKENFKPIYIMHYPAISCNIVVDGNHRVKELKNRNISTIKGYGLLPIINSKAMDKASFSLYTLHHNLLELYVFCNHPLKTHIKTEKSLKQNTFYGENLKLNFQLLKRIILHFIK